MNCVVMALFTGFCWLGIVGCVIMLVGISIAFPLIPMSIVGVFGVLTLVGYVINKITGR